MFDVLRFAMLQVVLADDFANGHVLNPIDWALMETQKMQTATTSLETRNHKRFRHYGDCL